MEDQEPGSVTILRRHADTHWLRLREKRRTEETGGALFSGPRQFELEHCVNDDDDAGYTLKHTAVLLLVLYAISNYATV